MKYRWRDKNGKWFDVDTECEGISFPGLEKIKFFVYYRPFDLEFGPHWAVTEKKTGGFVAHGKTKIEAIQHAEEILNNIPLIEIQKAIKAAKNKFRK